MKELKVHRLTMSEGGDIVLACRASYVKAEVSWLPKLTTCKNCKRVPDFFQIWRKGKLI